MLERLARSALFSLYSDVKSAMLIFLYANIVFFLNSKSYFLSIGLTLLS